MKRSRSIYAKDLEARGFDEWCEEGYARSLIESLPLDSWPLFFQITFFREAFTFVMDENGTVWASKGVIDLSELDFNEVVFEKEHPSRLN